MSDLLFDTNEWSIDTLNRIYDACEHIGIGEMGLNLYPNQMEVITFEQMLDGYSSAIPVCYQHWSYGKHFAAHEHNYRRGYDSLAYEIIFNSSPAIAYLMEDNTATMQALVIAHAAFGHNHVFKNNYMFKQWTDAEGIVDYLLYAKKYIERCEDKYGLELVEATLDAAHSLEVQAVHRYAGKKKLDLQAERLRDEERKEQVVRDFNDLWRTLPAAKGTVPSKNDVDIAERRKMLGLPEENLLYFLEKTAPRLHPWQREVLRIVRNIAQYFYPQRQTQVLNEGCAVYTHYKIMHRLHETGQLSDGQLLEFLHSHTNVTTQRSFKHANTLNPYNIGFALMTDIARIVREPTVEDREWFPDIAGQGDEMGVLKDVWANYRDESLIGQFLSPRMMREKRLFHVRDDPDSANMNVETIHEESGYRALRKALSHAYDTGWKTPNIEVVDCDMRGSRLLSLRHEVRGGTLLVKEEVEKVVQNIANLWGYEVVLIEATGGSEMRSVKCEPNQPLATA